MSELLKATNKWRKSMRRYSTFKSHMASNAVHTVPIKVLPYILNIESFCIHPSGTSAFLFDFIKNSFIKLDFSTGEQKIKHTDRLKSFEATTSPSKHIAFLQSSHLFILSMFKATETNRILFVLFSFNNDNISVLDEYITDLNGAEITWTGDFLKDENGQISFISYYWKENNTVFDVVNIDIDENGKIITTRVSNERLLTGTEWDAPFIYGGCYHWLSLQPDSNAIKLLRVPFHNRNAVEINIFVEFEEVKAANLTQSQIIGENVFIYFHDDHKDMGRLININLQEKYVKKLAIDSNEHCIARCNGFKMSENGFMYLRGQCTSQNCKDTLKAHIYAIDFSQDCFKRYPRCTEIRDLVPTKVLRGIKGAHDFCVSPLGILAFIFDHSKNLFVQIEMTTGEQTWFKTKWSKKFKSGKWFSSHICVLRSSKPLILSVFEEIVKNKIVLISFFFQKDEIFVVNELEIGIKRSDKSFTHIKQDENGEIFCLFYHYEDKETIFYAARVDLDTNGKISLNSLSSTQIMGGGWYVPFIHDGFYYWLSLDPDTFLRKLLRVKTLFDGEIAEEIILKNEVDMRPPDYLLTLSTQAQVIGDKVFYYTYDKIKKRGVVFYFELEEKCLQTEFIEMEHQISATSARLQCSSNGFLYLNGPCDVETCEDKTHICIFDVSKLQKKNDESKQSERTASENENSEPQLLRAIYEEVKIRQSNLYEEIPDRPTVEETECLKDKPTGKDNNRAGNGLKFDVNFIQNQQQTLNKAVFVRRLNLYDEIPDQPAVEGTDRLRDKPTHRDNHQAKNGLKLNGDLVQDQQQTQDGAVLARYAREEVDAYWRDAEEKIKEVHTTLRQKAAVEKFIPKNYVRQEELGRGGFGIVHKYFDVDAQQFFVAKRTKSNDQTFINIAKNEISRLTDVSHPHIIDYFGYKIEESSIIIFMEYMAAGSLRQIIKKFGLIKERSSIKYIGQILEGLAYIHNLGIVHCDLKCDNILNDGQGNIKLGDFGIAVQKAINDDNESFFSSYIKEGGGCYYWAAPEIIKHEGCTRRSDLWSLGCTIIEMLTGEPPYKKMAKSLFITATVNKTLSYDVCELVPQASKQMKTFLSKLLQNESDKRPRTGEDTIDMFKKVF